LGTTLTIDPFTYTDIELVLNNVTAINVGEYQYRVTLKNAFGETIITSTAELSVYIPNVITFTCNSTNNLCFSFNADGGAFYVDWGEGNVDTLMGTGSSQQVGYTYGGNVTTVNIIGGHLCYFKTLNAAGMGLTSLDLSATTTLNTVYCENNALTSLTLPATGGLTFIQCFNNQLQLTDLLAASNMVSNANNKRLGLQKPTLTGTAGTAIDFSLYGATEIEVDGTPESGTSYTFTTAGTYTVTMTNSAITSHASHPAKVVMTVTIP
jgi:hypothetical protein